MAVPGSASSGRAPQTDTPECRTASRPDQPEHRATENRVRTHPQVTGPPGFHRFLWLLQPTMLHFVLNFWIGENKQTFILWFSQRAGLHQHLQKIYHYLGKFSPNITVWLLISVKITKSWRYKQHKKRTICTTNTHNIVLCVCGVYALLVYSVCAVHNVCVMYAFCVCVLCVLCMYCILCGCYVCILCVCVLCRCCVCVNCVCCLCCLCVCVFWMYCVFGVCSVCLVSVCVVLCTSAL